jgi:hypothetical protein
MNDTSWQVRQAVVSSLGGVNTPKATNVIASGLNDNNLSVRRASALSLASDLRNNSGIRKPLESILENQNEDLWIRTIAASALSNAGYSIRPNLEEVVPLEKSMVVFVPGLDDPDLRTKRQQGVSWSKDHGLRKDFDKLEAMGGCKVYEFNWSGNYGYDYTAAEQDFIPYARKVYNEAVKSGADSITLVMHSAGNPLSYKGVMSVLEKVQREIGEEAKGIKFNFIGMGSPGLESAKEYDFIAKGIEGKAKNFWSILDPWSWPSAASPSSQMIISGHSGYFNHPGVRQTALEIATQTNVPLAYSSSASIFTSDPYLSTQIRAQRIITYPSPGVKHIETTIHTTERFYRTQMQPQQSQPDFSRSIGNQQGTFKQDTHYNYQPSHQPNYNQPSMSSPSSNQNINSLGSDF